jgi:hypothetical protein
VAKPSARAGNQAIQQSAHCGVTKNMKARLIPIFFDPGRDQRFDDQLDQLRSLLVEEAEFLDSQALGAPLPETDAVILPQLLGEGYRRVQDFRRISVPIFVVTSEFGTASMWDWELVCYLRSEGVACIAPTDLNETRMLCRALAVRRSLKTAKFLVYQDNPGHGQQAPIFKRFYWWEDECTRRMTAKFGITLKKRSFKELGERAKSKSDAEAIQARKEWGDFPHQGLSERALNSAAKLYLAVREDLDQESNVVAAGINCLNESHFSDTTPCHVWNRFYQERGLIWGCEADTVSMISKLILHRSLEVPILMTNLYPFLLGDAALKHERIERFPTVTGNPQDYLLVAHCGYMGVIPQPFATEWTLRKKVLGIVDENAHAIDGRIPQGDVTLAKLHPTFDKMNVTEACLEGYAQYPDSDCLNGGIIHVKDGKRLLGQLYSHHYLLMTGHHQASIARFSNIFGLVAEEI